MGAHVGGFMGSHLGSGLVGRITGNAHISAFMSIVHFLTGHNETVVYV